MKKKKQIITSKDLLNYYINKVRRYEDLSLEEEVNLRTYWNYRRRHQHVMVHMGQSLICLGCGLTNAYKNSYEDEDKLMTEIYNEAERHNNIFILNNKNYSFEEVDYLISLYHIALKNNDNILSILRYLNEEDSKLTLKRTKSF